MAVSKNEYVAWRNSGVTQEFLEDVLAEADAYISALVMGAGINSQTDCYNRGRIDGLKSLPEWQPEFVKEFEEEEEESDD